MGILLDTNHLFAYLYTRDSRHEPAKEVMQACLDGVHGRVVTTTFTLDELASIGQGKGLPRLWATELDDLMRPGPDGEATIELIHPSGATLERAHRRYVDRYDQGLSLTDWVQVVTMEEEGIARIATFDTGFQGLVDVVPAP